MKFSCFAIFIREEEKLLQSVAVFSLYYSSLNAFETLKSFICLSLLNPYNLLYAVNGFYVVD